MTKIKSKQDKVIEPQSELDAALEVIDVARKFIQIGQARKARTKAMQEAASIARKGGPSGKEVIKEIERKHPIVIDIGNAFDAIEEAVSKFDLRKRNG